MTPQSPANSSLKFATTIEVSSGAVFFDAPTVEVVPSLLNELSVGPESKRKALAAVYRRQRVGIFDEGRLVACFTRRHYRAATALAFLARRPEYEGKTLHAYTPRADAQLTYHRMVDEADSVLSSGEVLGLPPSRAQRMAAWAEAKGLTKMPTQEGVLGNPPF